MAWLVLGYEDEIHVVPDTEPGHVLAPDCFCVPVENEDEEGLWKHRDELNRLELDATGREDAA